MPAERDGLACIRTLLDGNNKEDLMRMIRKRPAAVAANKQPQAALFKSSLRTWQAVYKSQRIPVAKPLPKSDDAVPA